MACMVGFHDPGGFDTMTEYASELGKDFACIRVYMGPSEWGTVTPECSDIGHDPEKFRGTSSEYVAAFQYIVQRFRAISATNVRFDYSGTDPDASWQVIGFCYFHSPPRAYDFQFLRGPTAPDGKDGWIEAFSHDDYFTVKPRPISL